MKRYYYTDPLAGAWMVKHFGMKLLADDDEGGLVDAGARFIDCDDTFRELWQHDFSYLGKLYVHPDSLRLLKPMAGDGIARTDSNGETLVGIVWMNGGDQIGCSFTGDEGSYALDPNDQIIRRDGTAFHWPESEEA